MTANRHHRSKHHRPASRRSSPAAGFGVLGLALVAAVLAVFLFQCALYQGASLDDPYIAFRYAWNLAHGQGLIWNPGEAPVEGYTELLWVLFSAGAIAAGFQPLLFMQVLGVACTLAIILVVLTPLNIVAAKPIGRIAAAALLGVAPVQAFYAVSGMGHVFFELLITLAGLFFCLAVRRGGDGWFAASGAVFGLSAIARPEGLGLFLTTAAFAVAMRLWAGKVTWKNVWFLAGLFLCFWGPFFAWRLARYGYPFPNTYYAKYGNGGLRDLPFGLLYLSREIQVYIGIPLTAAAASYLFRGVRASGVKEVLQEYATPIYAALLTLAVAGYSTIIGGDDTSAFPSLRLLLPALPMAYMLAGAALEALVAKYSLTVASAVVALFLATSTIAMADDAFALVRAGAPDFNYQNGVLDLVRRAFFPTRSNVGATPLGDWINARLTPPCSIAIPWAGRISYEVIKCTVIDMDGLNDVHIAHLPKRQRGMGVKGDPTYVLARKPDMIFVNVGKDYALGKKSFAEAGGWHITEQETIALLKRSKEYRLVDAPEFNFTIYQRVK